MQNPQLVILLTNILLSQNENQAGNYLFNSILHLSIAANPYYELQHIFCKRDTLIQE